MVRRESHRCGVLGDVVQPNGLGVVYQHAEDAQALGQVADRLPHCLVDSLVDELDKLMIVAADAQGAILRVNQLDGGVHDGAKRLIELQPRRDHQHGVKESVEPIATFDDLLDAVLNFSQKLPQPQLRQRVTQRPRFWPVARPDRVGHVPILSLVDPINEQSTPKPTQRTRLHGEESKVPALRPKRPNPSAAIRRTLRRCASTGW